MLDKTHGPEGIIGYTRANKTYKTPEICFKKRFFKIPPNAGHTHI
jgi:hypothetical protein